MHQITIKNSSNDSSKPLTMPVLEKSERAKTRLQKMTTSPSKMFHHLSFPVGGSLTYLFQPTNLMRKKKSIPMSTFKISSIVMNSGDSAT